ncbi:hypothetical protein [Streptomyces sp. MUM 178J]|uniref:hypothetical protein n=1 Tax=Streptomyces sp. MUM 178J TaxID=2791991 RepID=UPI001F0370B6|nr:hypothetical protein [Streptomyces sp. MUM 178J]WRQ82152.1 hypothetical protein I3F59_023900 [Streptomyces sp. MUM 178J]
MPFEDDLGDAMRRTGDSFRPPDRSALATEGIRRGRRRLARRRAAAVTGGVLALAAVGLGGTYGGGLLGGADDAGRASSAAAADVPGTPTAPPADPDGSITGRQMLDTLKGLLPEGKITQEEGGGDGSAKPPPYASVVFDDGGGAAAIAVSLIALDPEGTSADGQVTCPSEALVPHDSCTAETLADGSRYLMFQGYEYPDRREETRHWRAALLTPKGVLVDASEYNAPAQKGAEVSRPAPPLTPQQMKALVTDEAWHPLMKELDEPQKEDPAPGAAGRDAVRDGLLGLLPENLEVKDKGGQDGFGFVVVEEKGDGKGASLIQINVQHGMGDVAGDLVSRADDVTTLPDGTKVMLDDDLGTPGRGTVGWTVDTLRTDGFRVVITAFNTGSQDKEATRAEPALTMEQLKTIALDDHWLSLR